MIKTLIGHTGFIGSYLKKHMEFDYLYNSSSLDHVDMIKNHGVIYCAAPTSSRIKVLQDPGTDYRNLEKLIHNLSKMQAERFVLLGSVDSHLPSKTSYGKHRYILENFVKNRFPLHHVLIIGSLIDPDLKKNILYDLKHGLWLSSINPADRLQWYPLEKLISDIDYCIQHSVKELHLVSEPIMNLDLVETFRPDYLDKITQKNTSIFYDFKPYRFTKAEILGYMSECLK